jgi:DNA-binding NarL/FixJ family response regulator
MRPVDRTILIVDDHAAFRQAARAVLRAEGLAIGDEAADGAEALAEAAQLTPAVVLFDIHRPDIDGVAVAERLAAMPTAPAVIFISSRDASEFGDRFARANVRGDVTESRLSRAAITAPLDSP